MSKHTQHAAALVCVLARARVHACASTHASAHTFALTLTQTSPSLMYAKILYPWGGGGRGFPAYEDLSTHAPTHARAHK